MMTQLQRDAMARAQAGDWLLADAMELLAEGRQWSGNHKLLGGVRGHSRLRFFVYGDHEECDCCNGGGSHDCAECAGIGDFECDTCDADGKVTCTLCEQALLSGAEPDCATCDNTRKLECADCKGTGRCGCEACEAGRIECDDCSGSGEGDSVTRRVADMNGRVVYDETSDETGDGPSHWVDFTAAKANEILSRYHNPPKPKPEPASVEPLRAGTQSALISGDLAA